MVSSSRLHDRRRTAEIRSSKLLFSRANWYILPYVIVAVTGVFAFIVSQVGPNTSTTTSCLLCAGYFAAIVVGYWLARESVCCHQLGVCFDSVFRRRSYRYEELAAMTYGPRREERHKTVYVNWVALDLEPISYKPRDRISFYDDPEIHGDELCALRNVIAGAMGIALLERVRAGGRANWVGPLCFEGDRMIYDHSPDGDVSIPIAEINRLEFGDYHAIVFVSGRNDPLCSFPIWMRNFYPGLFCLRFLREQVGAPPLFALGDDGELLPPG